jgi:hypothetical protein
VRRLGPLKAFASKYFTPVALVATVIGIGIALVGQRDAILHFNWAADPASFLLAVCLFAVAPLLQGFCFWLVLRALGVPSPITESLVIWSRSFLLRYAPSGALALVVRVRERDRLAATSGHIYTATGYEQLVALLSGALACVVCFLLGHARPPLVAEIVLVVAGCAAIAVRPGFLGRVIQARLAHRGFDMPAVMRGRHLAAIVAVNALGWLSTGAACYLLIDSITDDPMPGFLWLTGAYAFAFLLGFIVPLLPGGLGLRDGTMIAFLAGPFGAGAATAIAIALRLANTLGEFLAIGLSEGLYLIVSRTPRRVSYRWRKLPAAEVSELPVPGLVVEE